MRLALAQEDPLATIRDDVDAQVLPIFLDEAAELFPRAGEELRAWRRNPHDGKAVAELRRTLHTFKGSARMAGAMRLGELTHLLESHLDDADLPAHATPQMFEALETELDHIAFLLDRLRQGETNTPLPWVAVETEELPAAPPAEELSSETPVAVPALEAMPRRSRPPSARWSSPSRRTGGAGRSGADRGGRRRTRNRRPRATARASRHHRPPGERGRRGRDRACPCRG